MTAVTGRCALLTPAQAARRLRVRTGTLAVWHAAGRIGATRTESGQHRYFASEIDALAAGRDHVSAARAAGRDPFRCDACGYRMDSPGHVSECLTGVAL